jgi:Lysozyme like domain
MPKADTQRKRWWRIIKAVLIVTIAILAMAAKNPSCQSTGGDIPSGTLGCSQLERLWDDAGGPPSEDQMMAAIAMAESVGNQYAYLADSNGTNDEGYWAINSVNEGTYYPTGADRYDPLTNAKAAVAIYNGVGLSAWVTYNNGKEHGLCGIP